MHCHLRLKKTYFSFNIIFFINKNEISNSVEVFSASILFPYYYYYYFFFFTKTRMVPKVPLVPEVPEIPQSAADP